jgi:tetratricopeptide (TPR) repeat protein
VSDRCSRIFLATAAAILLVSLGAPAAVAADSRTDCRTGGPEVRIAACTQILQSNPSDFNALANRGVGFRMTGEYDRAVADFNQAMRLDPKNVAGLSLERGLAYAGSGDSQMAITDLSEALRRDSSLVQGWRSSSSTSRWSPSTPFGSLLIEPVVNRHFV